MRYTIPKTSVIIQTIVVLVVSILIAADNEITFSMFVFHVFAVYVVVLWTSYFWEETMNQELDHIEAKIDKIQGDLIDISEKLERIDRNLMDRNL